MISDARLAGTFAMRADSAGSSWAFSASATVSAFSLSSARISFRSRSQVSAQRCASVVALINCTLTRTAPLVAFSSKRRQASKPAELDASATVIPRSFAQCVSGSTR